MKLFASTTLPSLTLPLRRALALLGCVAGAVVLSGCVVAPVGDGYAGDGGYVQTSTVVYTQYGAPPPPRVEYRTVAPYPDYVWIGGDWVWGGRRYDWHPGRWDPPRRPYQGREPSRPGWTPPPPPRPRPWHGDPPQVHPPHFRPPSSMQPPPTGPRPWPGSQAQQPRPPHAGRPPGPRPDQVMPRPPRTQGERHGERPQRPDRPRRERDRE